jgi:hypothetical protein
MCFTLNQKGNLYNKNMTVFYFQTKIFRFLPVRMQKTSFPGITVDSVSGKVDETDLKEPTYTVKSPIYSSFLICNKVFWSLKVQKVFLLKYHMTLAFASQDDNISSLSLWQHVCCFKMLNQMLLKSVWKQYLHLSYNDI